jgi:hypothetical protein
VDGEYRRFGYTRVLRSFILPEHWGELKESPIWIDDGEHSGAYLVFDRRGVATVRDGDGPDSRVMREFYDPFAEDAVVRLFATGVRNAYDLVWHDNGFLYVAVNGGSGKGHTPDNPETDLDEELKGLPRQDDILFWLSRGDYAGHANPLRDEYVAFGGNPTAGVDPLEIDMYPVGLEPNSRFDPARAYSLGPNWSPTGTIVYEGYPGTPEFDGAVVFSNYSKGNNLRLITLDEDGGVAGDFFILDSDGEEIASIDPIDIALGDDGRIYVATLPRSNGRGKLIRLDPAIEIRADVGAAD